MVQRNQVYLLMSLAWLARLIKGWEKIKSRAKTRTLIPKAASCTTCCGRCAGSRCTTSYRSSLVWWWLRSTSWWRPSHAKHVQHWHFPLTTNRVRKTSAAPSQLPLSVASSSTSSTETSSNLYQSIITFHLLAWHVCHVLMLNRRQPPGDDITNSLVIRWRRIWRGWTLAILEFET